MRKPLRESQDSAGRLSELTNVSAPVKGWNTIQPVSNADPESAFTIDNGYITSAGVQMRPGSVDWSTGYASPVETIMPFRAFTAAGGKLFVATANGIFDATTQGAVGAAVQATTNGRFSFANFSNSAGQWLICVNGTDDMRQFNGTAWSSVANLSAGFNTNTLIRVLVYKNRLYFVPKDLREFWYLPTGAVTGTAQRFQVGQDLLLGGSIIAADTWTVDAGSGLDDYIVFLTTEGEMVVYSGDDPSSATSWNRKGVYRIGRPLGGRSTLKVAGDLFILTENGLFSLSDLMQSSVVERTDALSYNIETQISAAAKSAGVNTFGWALEHDRTNNLIFVNVPGVRENVQYVLSLQSTGWSSFSAWNARCWGSYGGEVYFGASNKVVKAMTGTVDSGGAAITATWQPAFSYLGSPGLVKHLKGIRPTFLAEGSFNYLVAINVDFDLTAPAGAVSSRAAPISRWDTAIWNQAFWSATLGVKRDWNWVQAKPGFCLSPIFKISSTTTLPTLVSIDYLFDKGDGVF